MSWIYGLGFLVWSTATGGDGPGRQLFLLAFDASIAGRIGESVAYPAYSKSLAGNFAEHQGGIRQCPGGCGQGGWPALDGGHSFSCGRQARWAERARERPLYLQRLFRVEA